MGVNSARDSRPLLTWRDKIGNDKACGLASLGLGNDKACGLASLGLGIEGGGRSTGHKEKIQGRLPSRSGVRLRRRRYACVSARRPPSGSALRWPRPPWFGAAAPHSSPLRGCGRSASAPPRRNPPAAWAPINSPRPILLRARLAAPLRAAFHRFCGSARLLVGRRAAAPCPRRPRHARAVAVVLSGLCGRAALGGCRLGHRRASEVAVSASACALAAPRARKK